MLGILSVVSDVFEQLLATLTSILTWQLQDVNGDTFTMFVESAIFFMEGEDSIWKN